MKNSTKHLSVNQGGIESNWVKHDFKINIEAGKTECFYQEIDADSVFHVSYQVKI